MTRTLTTVALVAAIIGTLVLITPLTAHSTKAEPTVEPPAPLVSDQQKAWMGALRWCESRGVDGAINKVDRDGTPSYGRYQFKPSTFNAYVKLYSIATSTKGVMDGDVQEAILEHMVADPKITAHAWKYSLFPDCVQRFVGLPPK